MLMYNKGIDSCFRNGLGSGSHHCIIKSLDWLVKRFFSLAQGPDQLVVQYTGCIVNDIRYLVRHNGETCNFYGILVNVIKVQFTRGFKVILFKCHWYNTDTRGKQVIRDYHLTSLNLNNRWYDGDPYVLAKQAHQVFYINDLKLGHPWKVVQKIQHRHVWDVPEKDDDEEDEEDNATDEDDDEYVDETENSTRRVHNDDEVDISLCREDVDPESFDINNEEVRRMLGLQMDEEEEEENDEEEEEEEDDDEENVGTNDTNDDYN